LSFKFAYLSGAKIYKYGINSFKEMNNTHKDSQNDDSDEGTFFRVRLPRGREVIGILEERLGGSRNRVRCLDGKVRISRIPGRLKRTLWVRPGDFVIVEPWEFGGDEKADVVYKYRRSQVDWLRKNNHIEKLELQNEF